MSKKDSLYAIAARLLFCGAKAVLSVAVGFAALGASLALMIYVADSMIKEGIHTPHAVAAY